LYVPSTLVLTDLLFKKFNVNQLERFRHKYFEIFLINNRIYFAESEMNS